MRCLVIALALVCAGFVCEAQTPPPVTDFSRNPQIKLPSVSPDGRHIAMISDSGGDQVVIVLSRDGAAPTGANVSEVRPVRLFWASDDILIIVASIAEDEGQYGVFDHATMFALDISRGGELRELFSGGRLQDDLAFNINRANVVGRIPETDELVVAMRTSRQERRLLAIDTTSGLYRTVDRTTEPVIDYVVDRAGNALARASYSVMEERYRLELKDGDYWTIVNERNEPYRTQSLWGLLAGSDDEIVVSERPSEGGRRLLTISASNGEPRQILYENADYDFEYVVRDIYTNEVVGVTIDEDMPSTVWFDEELANVQTMLDGALPDAYVTLLSWSEDRSEFILAGHRYDTPTTYYLFSTEGMSLASLGTAYPELAEVTLPVRQSVRYRARDGVRIPAYLTLPEGEGPFPLVVMPHGGPASRDVGGFDDFAHFFASRGYLVLQPNFRGSAGYGHAWESAGWGGWGSGIMQDDVTDGVSAMVRAGYADPDRVCIVGASYGGYSALAGAAFTPDVYQCAAAIAPLTDLWLIVRDAEAFGGIATPYSRRLAEQLTGTLDLPNRETVNAISPARHADAINIPILLIHGRDDSVVDDEHARAMVNSLENAGKDVTFLHLRDVDHWLSTAEARERVLTEVEAFLDQHIGE